MFNYDAFRNVDSEFRSAPFWSLNDKFQKEELERQIREMHRQGIGGFFMHPRRGLMDAYLQEDYIAGIGACVKQAEKLGMKAYLYDEDGFPSGNAAGLVSKDQPEYAGKMLVLLEKSCSEAARIIRQGMEENEKILAVFVLSEEENGKLSYTDVSSLSFKQLSGMEGRALLFKIALKRGSDLCHEDAVRKFIEITHEKYKEEFGQWFGSVIPGIFTDEPNFFAGSQEGRALPWTFELDKKFMKMKGYNLLDKLPLLFFNIEGYRKVRFDYWDTMTRLFAEVFNKIIYDWCEKNHIHYTGHFWEHGFPLPIHTGSTMPHYEYMQYPGIDMLFNTEVEDVQAGNVLIVKEVSSVANQLSKKRVLSETYGASGWDLDFCSQKRIADWQFALGINFVCQHLVHYSLKGYRKRDFPLSFLDHQPWWNSYRMLGDYIGRMSYIMSQGKYETDLLVLHPFSSVWPEYTPTRGRTDTEPQVNSHMPGIENSMKWLTKALCELHYQYDLGDDILMEKYGSIGETVKEGSKEASLSIGSMSYRTVVVPEMLLLRKSSFELLKDFSYKGGVIIAIGTTPYLLDGEESQELVDFFESDRVIKIKAVKGQLSQALRDRSKPLRISDINGKDTSDIYCHIRKTGDKILYFLCNISRTKTYTVRFDIGEAYAVEEWDGFTGDKKELPVYNAGGMNFVQLDFGLSASHLLIVDTSKKAAVINGVPGPKKQADQSLALYDWKVSRKDLNALTIKVCRFKIKDGEWSEGMDVLAADSKLKNVLGFKPQGRAPQPWTYSEEERSVTIPVQVSYTFRIDEMPEGALYAAIESPDEFTVFVNGRKAENTGCYLHDRTFVMHDIKDLVRPGENEVVLVNDKYNILSSVESIYIAGDFRLAGLPESFALAKESSDILPGDWTLQGYPYYSGIMSYSTEINLESDTFRKAELHLGELWMVACKIYVNDKEVADLGWKPYVADITGYLKKGSNKITVEVANSLRNLLGPHNSEEIDGRCTPGSFYVGDGDVRFVASGFDGDAVIKLFE